LKLDPAQRSSAEECLQEGVFDPFRSFVGIEDNGSQTPTQNNQSYLSMDSGSWDKVFEAALIERDLKEEERETSKKERETSKKERETSKKRR